MKAAKPALIGTWKTQKGSAPTPSLNASLIIRRPPDLGKLNLLGGWEDGAGSLPPGSECGAWSGSGSRFDRTLHRDSTSGPRKLQPGHPSVWASSNCIRSGTPTLMLGPGIPTLGENKASNFVANGQSRPPKTAPVCSGSLSLSGKPRLHGREFFLVRGLSIANSMSRSQ